MFGSGMALVVAATIAILLFILIVGWCYYISKRGTKVSTITTTTATQNQRMMEGMKSKIQNRARPNYNTLFKRGSYSTKSLFNWADHPSLIADAVENGWSRFAFTNNSSSSPSTTRSSLLTLVGDLHNQKENQVEITWEVGEQSVELMQKIRMNHGLRKFSLNSSSSTSARSAVKTGLPLPGPLLGINHSSFPQEAYFEITVLSVCSSPEDKSRSEGEKTKLIEVGKGNMESLDHEIKIGEKGTLMISVGLTSSSVVPVKIPGSYHGSIGFHSDGGVHLDGTKLVEESKKEEWGQEEKVIGCGYDPRQKKVFFTVDSKLVHVVHCQSEEFSTPLYPIIAANAEITLLVNMGQSRFLYEPANQLRTPNPCFSSQLMRSPGALGFEDSGELFSMGRIDSSWHHHCSTESSIKVNGDDESDTDLFEIVLDVNGKSVDV